MPAWTSEELAKIGSAEELQIASLRSDGTQRNPVTIWVVRHGDDLYVRSVKGRTGPWFRGTQQRHEGNIRAGGVDKDVTFQDAAPGLNDQIDEAYKAKYHRYAKTIVDSVLSAGARASTQRLVLRS